MPVLVQLRKLVPPRIAGVIVQLATRTSDEVPMQMILGVDAEKRVPRAEATRASEAKECRHLTVSTVFEDADLEWLTKLYLGLTDSLPIDPSSC